MDNNINQSGYPRNFPGQGQQIGGPFANIGSGNDDRAAVPYNVASAREIEVISQTLTRGFLLFALPAAVIGIAGTFFMRRRQSQMKATKVEKFTLGAIHYYGVTCLGLQVGLQLFGPIFKKEILEKIPQSDLAREIRKSASN